jgi:hypothetical protein
VPATLVPDLALAMRANDSLHEVLTNAGLSPRRSWVHASTEIFEGEVADQLDAPQSSLGWYIESLNVDESTLQPVSGPSRGFVPTTIA